MNPPTETISTGGVGKVVGPVRVQRQRGPGAWVLPPNTTYVGKPTRWANPFTPRVIPGWATASRQYAVDDFATWLAYPAERWLRPFTGPKDSVLAAATLREHLHMLTGRNLACFCPISQPCHVDVLLELANAPTI